MGPLDERPATERICKRLSVRNRQGLHARPAAMLVQVANRFKSSVRLRKGRRVADGKSIMGVLTLAAERGSLIEVTVEGPDAQEAMRILEQLISHADLPAVVHLLKPRAGRHADRA